MGALWECFVAEALKHRILRALERPGLQKQRVLRVFLQKHCILRALERSEALKHRILQGFADAGKNDPKCKTT